MKQLLTNLSVLEVSGKDSLTFLNSQFSNKLSDLLNFPEKAQINCLCQHQGKIIALMYVVFSEGKFFLIFDKSIEKKLVERLNTFKLMSEVKINPCDGKLKVFGVIDDIIPNTFKLVKNMYLHLASGNDLKESIYSFNIWEYNSIKNNLPEVYAQTTEMFIPQTLNLDINEIGVSFTKGCYPGQEVIARMHYLGKPKRRMFKFISKVRVKVGDEINIEESNSLKPSGNVIRVANYNEVYYFLGTLEVKHQDQKIFLGDKPSNSVKIINEI